MTELSSDFQGSPTSRIDFHLPNGPVSIKTSYVAAQILATVLPSYAVNNPGKFFKVHVGDIQQHVFPVDTPWSVFHDQPGKFEPESVETTRLAEKLTKTLNDDLALYFDEQGRVLSY